MDAIEVRLHLLRHGGSATETARALGIARSAVYAAVERATARRPITVRSIKLDGVTGVMGEDEEQAIAAYIRACLETVGISREAPNPKGQG